MPDIRLYQSALQHPERCFIDEELKTSTVVKANGGWMPLAWAGQFAVVFKLQTSEGYKAVRCFYHPRTEHEDRYKLFHQHLKNWPLNSLIHFDYQPEGILIDGDCYPIVKMDWVEGETLDKRVNGLVRQQSVSTLEKLSVIWREAAFSLRQASIAHGDMQHANILSQNGSLRLVDYDGVYIPPFEGKKPLENGHRNYQHPGRSHSDTFGLHIDHFSSFVIYLSLKALAVDPKLWKTYHQDDYLILKQDDYIAPHKSQAMKALKRSRDSQVRDMANKLEVLCALRVEDIPSFDTLVGAPRSTQTPAAPAPVPEKPWWLEMPNPVIAATGSAPATPAVKSPEAPPPSLPEVYQPVPIPQTRRSYKMFWMMALIAFLLLMFAFCSISFLVELTR